MTDFQRGLLLRLRVALNEGGSHCYCCHLEVQMCDKAVYMDAEYPRGDCNIMLLSFPFHIPVFCSARLRLEFCKLNVLGPPLRSCQAGQQGENGRLPEGRAMLPAYFQTSRTSTWWHLRCSDDSVHSSEIRDLSLSSTESPLQTPFLFYHLTPSPSLC